ncbi:unnamed protein product [Medioppia subpectinata]|uniref:Uncharacterized protein n=1 Tax=Medioppia subpectinata TaxID=1979941 RepID=A0A7R9Q6E1_9ACAR|nr:unnamed protein product [Medioppia subpectinata]CAG2113168.1 unnamed protein product [Medioppia subpectinata]
MTNVRLISGKQMKCEKWLTTTTTTHAKKSSAVERWKAGPKTDWKWCSKRCLSHQALDSKPKHSSNVYLIQKPDTGGRLVFTDNENQLAFKIIESLLNVDEIHLDQQPLQTEDLAIDEIMAKFVAIPPEGYIGFAREINGLVKVLKSLNLRQLMTVLESLTKWSVDQPFDTLYYRVWSNVDFELDERLTRDQLNDNKDVEKYLLFGNMFYRLKTANICKFNDSLVKRLSSPDFELNKTGVLHLLFYSNLHRKVDPKCAKYMLSRMESMINDMTLDQMAVFCMTSFKTETKLTDSLFKSVISRMITDVSEETNNILRTAVTKCIRHSYHYKFKPEIGQYVNRMKQLSNNSEYSKLDFERHLLVTNTALSIEKYEEFGDILLEPEMVYRYHRMILTQEKQTLSRITQKQKLLNTVYMGLKTHLGERVQMSHILPFKSYPQVVIWSPNHKNFSLTPETVLKQNMFNNCFAIYVLDIRDYLVIDTHIKGSVQLEIRLLEGLGFKIPKHYFQFPSTSEPDINK